MHGIAKQWFAFACAAALTLGWAAAANADAACKQAAKSEYLACKTECKNDYVDSKLACRNVEQSCGLGCLAGRETCNDGVDAILSTGALPGAGTLDNCSDGTDGCQARLADAKAVCGAPCNGDATCDACVDAAQITAFTCRDTCRESWRGSAVVKALEVSCRATFKGCIGACPPAQ
jgi:hypothetical protein